MTRSALALTVALGILAAPVSSWAQGADNKAAAEALFEEGRRLMDQGKFPQACEKLEGSQKLDPGAGTLMNLAACYDKSGRTASAWVTYKDAASAAAARHPDWAAQAQAQAAALEPKLSRLTITVQDKTQGLVVTRDGVTVEPTVYGVAIPVDPGAHTVEAHAPGRKGFKGDVTVGADKDTKALDVPVLALGEDPSGAPASSSGAGLRIAGVTAMGAGAVGVLLGSIFGVMALDKKGAASDPTKCAPDFSVCNDAGKALVDEAKTAGTISTVAFVAGGVLAAGGLVMFLLAPKDKPAEPKTGLRVGAEGAWIGVTVRGAF